MFHHKNKSIDKTLTRWALVFVATFLVWGCGSDRKPSMKVTGEITFEGQPVTKGEVSFEAEDGAAATVPLDSEGKFVIESLPVGEYRVSITPPPITEAPSEDPSKIELESYDNIPDGYQTSGSTDLLAEVTEEGDNHFKLNMKKDGPGGGGGNPMESAP